MTYCIDTSALIDAWIRWYPPDSFPTLWARIAELVDTTQLISSDEVLQELKRKEGDSLFRWAKEHERMFLPLDADVQLRVNTIMKTHPRLVDGRTGKSFADPFVIATAQVRNGVVITGEGATGAVDRPKIPDVCRDLNIPCIRFTDLIRRESWRF